MGLGGVNALRAEGEDAEGVDNAVEFIAELRQADDLSALPVGRRVVVVGGGMTAIDAAVQSKLLGAEEVTIVYRRGKEHMNASEFEQDLAASKGVNIRHWLQPKRVIAKRGKVAGIELEYTAMDGDKLVGTGETVTLAADQVFKAIGQSFAPAALNGSGPTMVLEGHKAPVVAVKRALTYCTRPSASVITIETGAWSNARESLWNCSSTIRWRVVSWPMRRWPTGSPARVWSGDSSQVIQRQPCAVSQRCSSVLRVALSTSSGWMNPETSRPASASGWRPSLRASE